jgi:hypothetical protein
VPAPHWDVVSRYFFDLFESQCRDVVVDRYGELTVKDLARLGISRDVDRPADFAHWVCVGSVSSTWVKRNL